MKLGIPQQEKTIESFDIPHSWHICFHYYQILGKSIRIDHVNDYKPPKNDDRYDEITQKLHTEGCAPKEQMPESHIKRERVEKPTRKRSPVEADLKRVKRERSDEEEVVERVSLKFIYFYQIPSQFLSP